MATNIVNGLQSTMRKPDYASAIALAAPLVSALAAEHSDQDGLGFVEAVIDAVSKVRAMTAASQSRNRSPVCIEAWLSKTSNPT